MLCTEPTKDIELLLITDFSFIQCLNQELDAAIVGFPAHRVGVAILTYMSKVVACRFVLHPYDWAEGVRRTCHVEVSIPGLSGAMGSLHFSLHPSRFSASGLTGLT